MAAAREAPSRAGMDDRNRLDLISRLPDGVLGTIISLLPTKAGCRTQALSRRWRPIWCSAPLNLDGTLPEKTVTSLLSCHLGPVRRILVSVAPLSHRCDCRTERQIDADAAMVDGWLHSRGIAYLDERRIVYRFEILNRDVLPLSVFHRVPALRVATFGCCRLPPNLAVDFPFLQQLTLHDVTLTEVHLSALLSGCPVLESLLLDKIVGSHSFRVSSPSLRSIGFCALSDTQVKLVIEDAPCLQRLLPFKSDDRCPPTIIRAPNKLEILGYRISSFQETVDLSLTTTMHTVKVLALCYVGPDLNAVLDFLNCFPCLERLYVHLHLWSPPMKITKSSKDASADEPTKCVELHLKKVALKVYHGVDQEIEFARFFVLNAKVLERMEFGVLEHGRKKWTTHLCTRLKVGDRVSHSAEFKFKKYYGYISTDKKKFTHDLSIVDPFDTTFFNGYVAL